MTTLSAWRDLLEVACMRQTTAFDLVEECGELYGPTHNITAVAYTNWIAACERQEACERQYQAWLRERNAVALRQYNLTKPNGWKGIYPL